MDIYESAGFVESTNNSCEEIVSDLGGTVIKPIFGMYLSENDGFPTTIVN